MDVKVPNLGEGADSGVVVGILVQVGDQIKPGQTIAEIENEKAIAPIPSPVSGRVTQISVKVGQQVSVGHRLLMVEQAGGAPDQKAAPAPASKPAAAKGSKAIRSPAPPVESDEVPEPAVPAPRALPPAAGLDEVFAPPGTKPAASPSIRKLARELGLDLSRVRGSERGGRIVMDDLRAYLARLQEIAFAPPPPATTPGSPAPAPPVAPLDFSAWGSTTRKPLSSLRQVISRRMTESWRTIPQVNQFDDADISNLVEFRKKYGPAYEGRGARLTLTPFILKALVAALKQSPIFNASLDEATHEVVFKEYYHIGLAVDTDAGLIVPVIRDVDKKDLLALAKELQDLAERARTRKIASEEMKGGTFTVSNQGGIGGGYFTPIINPPEAAILGVGRSGLKPVARGPKIEVRTLMPLCVTYDHRLIDGGSAARFIGQIVQALENFSENQVKL